MLRYGDLSFPFGWSDGWLWYGRGLTVKWGAGLWFHVMFTTFVFVGKELLHIPLEYNIAVKSHLLIFDIVDEELPK